VDAGFLCGNAVMDGARMKEKRPVFYTQAHKHRSRFVDIINRKILKYFSNTLYNFFWIYPLVGRIYPCVVKNVGLETQNKYPTYLKQI
jgi:hypothetical protein